MHSHTKKIVLTLDPSLESVVFKAKLISKYMSDSIIIRGQSEKDIIDYINNIDSIMDFAKTLHYDTFSDMTNFQEFTKLTKSNMLNYFYFNGNIYYRISNVEISTIPRQKTRKNKRGFFIKLKSRF